MAGTYSRVKTWSAGEILTAAALNAEFDNEITNADPDSIGDESATNTEMRAVVDPGESGSESLATDLKGEIHRLRNIIQEIHHGTYWYSSPTDLHTIYIPANAMTPTLTNGAEVGTDEYVTNDVNYDYLAFDGATDEFACFNIPMPEDWDRSTIQAKFLWSSATGSTAGDTMSWDILAGAISNDDAIDAAYGTAGTANDVLLANNGTDMQISPATGAVTVGGTPALGDMVQFKVQRDVTDDNMAEDAWLFGCWIQYTADKAVAAW